MTSLKTLVALLSENILRKGIQNLQLPNPSDGDDVEKNTSYKNFWWKKIKECLS